MFGFYDAWILEFLDFGILGFLDLGFSLSVSLFVVGASWCLFVSACGAS